MLHGKSRLLSAESHGLDDQYDAIGELYQRVKHIPVGLAERATLLSALPDLTGGSVLDIGCGTGFYPRLFRGWAPVGWSASTRPRDDLLRAERRGAGHARYLLRGARRGLAAGHRRVDVVTAVWLLGYAEGERALDGMLARIRPNVAPGGVFVRCSRTGTSTGMCWPTTTATASQRPGQRSARVGRVVWCTS